MTILAIVLGFILDLILGDPQNWPHPVRLIGRLITHIQNIIRTTCQSYVALKWAGLVLWILVVSLSYGTVWGILKLSEPIFTLHFIIEVWMIYTILATKSLKDAAMSVHIALRSGSIIKSRNMLSYIVGRDTTQLNEAQIIRAVIETVAENTVDGIIAPLFFLFIGGAPLAMAYKAVNTLDSMVGYPTPKYKAIGFVSAKMDDLANYVPARLSWLMFSLAAFILRLDAKSALLIGWRDRYQHKSPNCAWSEASVAGALGIQLGGPNVYFDLLVEKPWIGQYTRPVEHYDIKRTIALMYVASTLSLLLFLIILEFASLTQNLF